MADINQLDTDLEDAASRSLGFGGVGGTTYSVLHGLNVLGGVPALPANADHQGFTFFTKPCLNLSYNNVIGTRKLAFLANQNRNSMGMAIKCMLSPYGFDGAPSTTLAGQVTPAGDHGRSNIIDDQCAFLPISNFLLSLSAPPDIVADIYTSNEGYNKEQVSWIDSKPNYYGAYDLTATFINMEGDPITTIISTWMEYAMRVLEGSMLPFPINIVENRVDYQTRIYRLVMDRSKRFVQRIYACGAAFPTSVPTGAVMGYSEGKHLSPEADQIQVTFRCVGAMYDDPILITEFNMTVMSFNQSMTDANRSKSMKKVEGVTETGLSMRTLLNYKMYPRISPTMELEWWAFTKDYTLVTDLINRLATAAQPTSDTAINTNTILSPWVDTMLATDIAKPKRTA